MSHTSPVSVALLADIFERLRGRTLHIHALTSPVAAERTANTLLALGVRPSLTVNPEEIGAFVARCDGLLINLGMADPVREQGAAKALATIAGTGKRWVLDPVFVDVSPRRRAMALDMVAAGPAILKANVAESAIKAHATSAMVCVVTGDPDLVTQDERRLTIANGHVNARRVTAMGCALGAVMAAFLAVEEDAFLAAAAALVVYGIAGDIAGRMSAGPGSFATSFLDALSAMDGNTVKLQANIT